MSKKMWKTTLAALGVAVAMVIVPAPAQANTITVNHVQTYECDPTDASPSAGSGFFCWEYEAAWDADSRVTEGNAPGAVTPLNSPEGTIGDYFTVYDFEGYTGDCFAFQAGWDCQSLFTGSTNQGNVGDVGDDPTIANVTWWYDFGPDLVGAMMLQGFIAVSIYDQEQIGDFSSEDTKHGGPVDGSTNRAAGFTVVPLAEDVPEPGSLLLMGLGLIGAAGAARRRMRK